jgi:hypothetical protein
MKQLVVERPHEEPELHPFDDGVIRRFHFEDFEVEALNADKIVWRGDTAFSVEDDSN